MIKKLLLFSVIAVCYGFQEAPEGTVDFCNNYRNAPAAHRCACAKATMACKMPGDAAKPDAKCKTYCREDHCHCSGPACTSNH